MDRKLTTRHLQILIPLWLILIFTYSIFPKIYLENISLKGNWLILFETTYDVIVLTLIVMLGVLVTVYIKKREKEI